MVLLLLYIVLISEPSVTSFPERPLEVSLILKYYNNVQHYLQASVGGAVSMSSTSSSSPGAVHGDTTPTASLLPPSSTSSIVPPQVNNHIITAVVQLRYAVLELCTSMHLVNLIVLW